MCEGDKKAEAEVDDSLLIPFRHFFRWNVDDASPSSSSSSSDKHYKAVAVDVKNQVLSTVATIILIVVT